MKQNKKQYASPSVETMECNVEKGYACSGCGGDLESLTQGIEVGNMFN